jgi:hypothetical protein
MFRSSYKCIIQQYAFESGALFAVGTVIAGVAFGTVMTGAFESVGPPPLPFAVESKTPAGDTFAILLPLFKMEPPTIVAIW